MVDAVDDMEVMAAVGVSSGFSIMAGAVVKLCCRKRIGKTRPVHGAYSILLNDLMNTDAASFKNYTRMNLLTFEDLLSRVEGAICKHNLTLMVLFSIYNSDWVKLY